MTFSVDAYLKQHGPTRASIIAAALQATGLTAEAARQRVSRTRAPVRRFPIPLLPKREGFLYLESQRNTEQFWDNLLRDLRDTGAVYAAAIDGMLARGGMVLEADFAAISGAPARPLKKQVAADLVLRRLKAAGAVSAVTDPDIGDLLLARGFSERIGKVPLKARRLAEDVLLDGVREWARKLGMASYNSISIRGESSHQLVGSFAFDLGGPSYLLPLQGLAGRNGFLAADIFAEGTLTPPQIQFFIRKAKMLKASLPGAGALLVLVADSFDGAALTAGHAAGIMMATPKDLFGQRVGSAMRALLETLRNAAAYASSSPDRLVYLLDNLVDIEGRAGNLRGILFELVAGYLARRDAVSIDIGVIATDPETGRKAEIDVQKVTAQASAVTAIECKGKSPGGVVDVEEVRKWLTKLPIIKAHYRAHTYFREAQVSFELWTSGTFSPDAVALLEAEKARRTRAPIGWRDGQSVLELAATAKEKAIADALFQHYLKHPLSEIVTQIDGQPVPGSTDAIPSEMTRYYAYASVVTPPPPPDDGGPAADRSVLASPAPAP
jgi:hypothetical protein